MKPASLLCSFFLLCWSVPPAGSAPDLGYLTWDADMIDVERVTETGAGVYVAVLDTGLAPNWRDYFPRAAVATHLGTGFEQSVTFRSPKLSSCEIRVERGPVRQSTWVGSVGSTHGTHVVSTILGYRYQDNADTLAGYPLPAIQVRGLAPGVTVIPVKVIGDHQIPAMPTCGSIPAVPAQEAVFGTEKTLAAGIDYVRSLAEAGHRPMVINLSLGGGIPDPAIRQALDRAIESGVIIVAAAGNHGTAGMSFPGAYAPVISVGAAGWVGEWLQPWTGETGYRMWWLQYPYAPLVNGSGEVRDPTNVDDVYVAAFSSRALGQQQLDVLAPGSWVRGPYPGYPGYSHLPWWSSGIGDLQSRGLGNFYHVGGSSMAVPHVASVVALMLERNPHLTQREVEEILKETALQLPLQGVRVTPGNSFPTVDWDSGYPDGTFDPVGAGLVRAADAVSRVSSAR